MEGDCRNGEEHRWWQRVSEIQRIFSVFNNAHYLDAFSIRHLIVAVHRVGYGAEDSSGKLSRLITATSGAFLSSCHVNSLPASKGVPAARKYSGEVLNVSASAAAVDGLRSVVSSVKTFDAVQAAR